MTMLALGLLLFLGVHSTRIFADGWRTSTVAHVGEGRYKGLYTLLSLAGFALLVWGYGQSRQQMPLWNPPVWTKHLTALLMLPVFPLFIATYIPRNALKARLKHPQVLSVKLWAVAHLVSNGNVADVVLFGSFLVWAALDFRAAKGRDRKAEAVRAGDPFARAKAVSPHPGPPRGGQGGKKSQGEVMATVMTIVLGVVLYIAFALWLHGPLIGVRPFG